MQMKVFVSQRFRKLQSDKVCPWHKELFRFSSKLDEKETPFKHSDCFRAMPA